MFEKQLQTIYTEKQKLRDVFNYCNFANTQFLSTYSDNIEFMLSNDNYYTNNIDNGWIGDVVFYSDGIKRRIRPTSMTAANSFDNAEHLYSIAKFADNISSIAPNSFNGLNELFYVNFNNVQKIEDNSFNDCSCLKILDVSKYDGLIPVGENCFKNLSVEAIIVKGMGRRAKIYRAQLKNIDCHISYDVYDKHSDQVDHFESYNEKTPIREHFRVDVDQLTNKLTFTNVNGEIQAELTIEFTKQDGQYIATNMDTEITLYEDLGITDYDMFYDHDYIRYIAKLSDLIDIYTTESDAYDYSTALKILPGWQNLSHTRIVHDDIMGEYEDIVEPIMMQITNDGSLVFANNGMQSDSMSIDQTMPWKDYTGENEQSYSSQSELVNVYSSMNSNCKRIQQYAFSTSFLNNIILPSMQEIGFGAFENINHALTIYMPNVLSVYNLAFYRTKQKKIEFPLLQYVGNAAFKESMVEEISLPNVKFIDDEAFAETQLKNVDLKNVKSVGVRAFAVNQQLQTIKLDSAHTIGNGAFNACNNLETISLKSAIQIGDDAFEYCDNLKTVYLNSMTINDVEKNAIRWKLGVNEQYNSSGMFEVDVVCLDNNGVVQTFKLNNSTPNGSNYFTFKTLGSSIEHKSYSSFIGDDATPLSCSDCNEEYDKSRITSLTSTTQANCKYMDDFAFLDCNNLTTVDMPTIQSIGMYCFNQCDNLKTVKLNNMTEIQSYAFMSCSRLNRIEMKNVDTIENCQRIFRKCNTNDNTSISIYLDGQNSKYSCNEEDDFYIKNYMQNFDLSATGRNCIICKDGTFMY